MWTVCVHILLVRPRASTGAHAGPRVRASRLPATEVVHLRASQEPLLWVSDGIAWCLQRGGPWASAVAPLIALRTTLS